MKIPTSLADLAAGAAPSTLHRISSRWGADAEAISTSMPDDAALYRLIDELGRLERWTLFAVLESGGRALARDFPQRGAEGPSLEINHLRDRGLLFVVSVGANLDNYYVIPDEFALAIHRYREQLLLMKLAALRDEMEKQAVDHEPLQLPEFIRPHIALSHLLATGDPEGFRYPLSRALGIPETFKSSAKPILRAMLHEFYLLFLPYLGRLEPDKAYAIEGLVTLGAGVGALLGHHHSQALSPELCDEEDRPFAFANAQLASSRRAFWRSFAVLFLEGLLQAIGAARPVLEDRFQVHPPAFHRLDIEVQRPRWVVHALREWQIEVES